jgi:hypothetical protein
MITQQPSSQTLVLVATNDFGASYRYELKNDQGVFVGRSSNCGLQLHDNKIGDIHCRIEMVNGKLRIQNWMSAEGTFVNGTEISSELEIGLLDTVQVGGHRIRILAGKSDQTTTDEVTSETTSEAALGPPPARQGAPAEPASLDDAVAMESERDATGDLDVDDVDAVSAHIDAADSLLESLSEKLLKSESDLESQWESADDASSSLVEDFIASEDQPRGELDLVGEPTSASDEDSIDLDGDFFEFDEDEEETFDRETVALLQAEIEDLRAALAQRDADQMVEVESAERANDPTIEDQPDDVLQRMQELIDEANRSDERVALLEEMLLAAEDTNRSEREERSQLEAWVRDIEKKVGDREEEHAAELEALKARLQESAEQQQRLQKQLRKAASGGDADATKQYDQILESLQQKNRDLEEGLAEAKKQCLTLEKRLESAQGGADELLRAERAKLAKEQAAVSRLRYELSSKLSQIEQMPQSDNRADQETGQRIRALREHLREIHQQEKEEVKESTLTTRLAKLWKRVEY